MFTYLLVVQLCPSSPRLHFQQEIICYDQSVLDRLFSFEELGADGVKDAHLSMPKSKGAIYKCPKTGNLILACVPFVFTTWLGRQTQGCFTVATFMQVMLSQHAIQQEIRERREIVRLPVLVHYFDLQYV